MNFFAAVLGVAAVTGAVWSEAPSVIAFCVCVFAINLVMLARSDL